MTKAQYDAMAMNDDRLSALAIFCENQAVEQLRQERTGNTPTSKAMTPEQQQIQELQTRIRKIERENDILKKATALLMSGSLDR